MLFYNFVAQGLTYKNCKSSDNNLAEFNQANGFIPIIRKRLRAMSECTTDLYVFSVKCTSGHRKGRN
jgi:hypothetical protein